VERHLTGEKGTIGVVIWHEEEVTPPQDYEG